MMSSNTLKHQRNDMRIGPLGIPEIVAILLVIMLIFGARRLPEIGSSLGRGIRTFKSALTGEDDKSQEDGQKAGTTTGDELK